VRAVTDIEQHRGGRPGKSQLPSEFAATIAQVEELFESEPQLVDDWLRYSEDKRTSAGWAFFREGETWVVSQPFPNHGTPVSRRYIAAFAACADYVLSELDFWADADDPRPPSDV